MKPVAVGTVIVGGGSPLAFIAGPCVIESAAHALEMATAIREIAARAGVPVIFKASYDKANRTSRHSFRGPDSTKACGFCPMSKPLPACRS